MMNNISFLIPEHETIPTKLRLIISKDEGKDITVNYVKLNGKRFGYHFDLYNITSIREADDIIEEIANQMCFQSFDHGQEWRTENIEQTEVELNYAISHIGYDVTFRIRDSY